jgi:hypothetical protein
MANKTFSVRHGIDVANTIVIDSNRNLSNIANANVITINATNFVTTAGLNLPNHTNNAYAAANAAANTVRISQNSGSTLSGKQLNFINSAAVLVSVTDAGDGNANVQFFASGASAADAYSQANAAYDQANNAYTAANNAQVTVYANSGSSVTTQKLNFVNTSTVTVSVSNSSGNANVEITSLGSQEYSYNTTTTNAETIDSWSADTYRSGKYQLQVSSSVGYFTCEIFMIHNGNVTNMIQLANVGIGSNVGSFSTDISSGNVRLRFNAVDSTSRIRYYRSLLKSDPGSDPEVLPTDLMTGTNSYDLMNNLFIIPTDLNA